MFVTRGPEPKVTKGIFSGHLDVLKYYQIPTLNYDMSASDIFLIGERHPAWPYHQMIADFMAYVWKNEASKACGYQIRPPIGRLQHLRQQLTQFCMNPLSLYRAKFPRSFHDVNIQSTNDAWKLYEDVAGKPGWIVESHESSTISFPIKIDQQRHLVHGYAVMAVSYLKSYDGMGAAKVYINDDKSRYVILNGSNDDPSHHVSLVYSKRLCISRPVAVTDNSTHIIPFCEDIIEEDALKSDTQRGYEEVTLNIELLPDNNSRNKFKVIDILSC